MAIELNLDTKDIPSAAPKAEPTALGSITPQEEKVAVKVLFITPESGIDYKTLQNNGQLKWEIHRLLWIGYQKNVDNNKCYFAKLPKDVIKCIVKFFLIDDSYFTDVYFAKKTSFRDIAERYALDLKLSTRQFFERKQIKSKHFDIPFVHIWVQFGCIKHLYPVEKRIIVTEEDLKNVNLKKWVEVPDDFSSKNGLSDCNFDEYNRICVEFVGIRDIDDSGLNNSGTGGNVNVNVNGNGNSSDSTTAMVMDDPKLESRKEITPWHVVNSRMFWPLAKADDEWKDFQVGDIVDIIVKYNIVIIYMTGDTIATVSLKFRFNLCSVT